MNEGAGELRVPKALFCLCNIVPFTKTVKSAKIHINITAKEEGNKHGIV